MNVSLTGQPIPDIPHPQQRTGDRLQEHGAQAQERGEDDEVVFVFEGFEEHLGTAEGREMGREMSKSLRRYAREGNM